MVHDVGLFQERRDEGAMMRSSPISFVLQVCFAPGGFVVSVLLVPFS